MAARAGSQSKSWSSMLISRKLAIVVACGLLGLELHSFSSQKHIRPLPPPSDMHTWSKMKRLISKLSVQPRRIFISAAKSFLGKLQICYCTLPKFSLSESVGSVIYMVFQSEERNPYAITVKTAFSTAHQ